MRLRDHRSRFQNAVFRCERKCLPLTVRTACFHGDARWFSKERICPVRKFEPKNWRDTLLKDRQVYLSLSGIDNFRLIVRMPMSIVSIVSLMTVVLMLVRRRGFDIPARPPKHPNRQPDDDDSRTDLKVRLGRFRIPVAAVAEGCRREKPDDERV